MCADLSRWSRGRQGWTKEVSFFYTVVAQIELQDEAWQWTKCLHVSKVSISEDLGQDV